MKMKTTYLIWVLGILSLTLYGWGCNPFQSAQEKVQEKMAEKMVEGIAKQQGVDMDIDIQGEGGTITLSDEEGGGEMAYGEDVAIPKDLPDGVKVYDGAKAVNIMRNISGTNSVMMTLLTEDDLQDVADWYEEEYTDDGWESKQTVSMGGAEMRGFEKGEEQVVITIGRSDDDDETTISISWSDEN